MIEIEKDQTKRSLPAKSPRQGESLQKSFGGRGVMLPPQNYVPTRLNMVIRLAIYASPGPPPQSS